MSNKKDSIKPELIWNTYISNFNSGLIEVHNIFHHAAFRDGCRKAAKKFSEDREAFAEQVRKELMYYYWSKCEWEIVLEHWPSGGDRFKDMKIDVYDQVQLNWPVFIDWLWEHRKEL